MKIALALAAAVLLTGCGSGSGQSPATPGRTTTLTVLAAASLTEAFGALEMRFEADNPTVDVKISFAGSSALAQQIDNGSPADVFASADEANMTKVVQAGHIDGTPQIFATNKLTIVTAPGNPKGIHSLADLTAGGVTLVECAVAVPCGSAAHKVADLAHVTLKPVSEEQDVKAVLTKVRAGEADAGLVYVTDADTAGGTVAAVDFAEAALAVNKYPVAVVKDSKQADLARRFVDLVRGDAGRQELAKVGFSLP